jgi:hypothetical protein
MADAERVQKDLPMMQFRRNRWLSVRELQPQCIVPDLLDHGERHRVLALQVRRQEASEETTRYRY